MKIVVKIGGSIFFTGADNVTINMSLVQEFASSIKKLVEKGHVVNVVVGGGKIARKYINAVKKISRNETSADVIGADVARLNARVLIAALGDLAWKEPPRDFRELSIALESGKIVVCGGLQPGQSTDAVSALLAEYICADFLIKTTDVDKVYNKDPKKYSDAVPLDRITVEMLEKLINGNKLKGAGEYALFDSTALNIIKRSRINTIFINGFKPSHLTECIKNESIGTRLIF